MKKMKLYECKHNWEIIYANSIITGIPLYVSRKCTKCGEEELTLAGLQNEVIRY